MKKRRILALLLALSLSVNMNGMTVFAASSDAADYAISAEADNTTVGAGGNAEGVQQTEGSGEEDKTDHPDGAGADNSGTDGEAAVPDDAKEDSGQEGSSGNQGSTEDDSVQDEEQPSGDENGKGDGNESEDNAGTGENPDDMNTDDAEQTEDIENPEDEESVSENTVEEDTEKNQEELPKTTSQSVRMVTFTDDTGMRVTYNENEQYNLTINEGVLNGITKADGTAVEGVVAIPEGKGITAIGTAFQGNAGITYVKLPEGVTSIQNNAFNNCYRLEGIYLPGTTQTIGDNAFYRCTALLKLAIPKRVTSIGNAAFYGDEKLFMVYMQDADYSSLVSIGDEAFYQCRVLEYFGSDKEFIVPGQLESVGAVAFYDCRSIKELEFGESLKIMGEGAFQYCNSLKSLILPGSLKNIPKNAFSGCNKLVNLQFKRGNESIGESAFEGCIQLGGLTIPGTVNTLANYAFKGCTGLMTVEVQNSVLVYGESVFPNQDTLTLIGAADSTTDFYTRGKNIKFVPYMANQDTYFYRYTTVCLGDGNGVLEIKDVNGTDPNTLNKNQGVKAGTKLYVYVGAKSTGKLVSGSIKCNGEPVKQEKGGDATKFYFLMPMGGARITAEFEIAAPNKNIAGQADDVKIEISYGGEQDAAGRVSVKLKAGQYSRMFLTDAQNDNKAIPSAKIEYKSDTTSVATVAKDGTIHAIKKGYTVITAKLYDSSGKSFTKSVRVDVAASEVAQLKIRAYRHDASQVEIETSSISGTQVAVIDKNRRNEAEDLQFDLKTTAYDEDGDNVAVALKWSTSDAKVAKISKTSTTVENPNNIVTVPRNTTGEATIRVTATRADKKTVTQKFIIRIVDQTPRLNASSLTVNPNRTDGALLQIISAYGKQVDKNRVKLIEYDSDNNKVECQHFDFTYLAAESDSTVTTFRLTTPHATEKDRTEKVYVEINGGEDYDPLPLSVTVKTSKPNPKFAFEKKQPKKNLFYADDGTEFTVNISNLGKVEVAEYSLEPLDDKNDDDLKFKTNFEVEYVDKDTCIIRQQSDKLECAEKGKNKGKPVVSGVLRLYYEGFRETIYQDLKITLPTQRTVPSMKLNRTTDTFKRGCGEQDIELQIVDKKNQPVDLSDGNYKLCVVEDEDNYLLPVQNRGEIDIVDDGKFTLTLVDAVIPGKVKLCLTNSLWAETETISFVYTVKFTDANPKISLTNGPGSDVALKASTVTLNPNYPEQIVEFGLKSNQRGTVIADEQEFKEKPTKATANYFRYLEVQYVNGVGSVTVTDPGEIKDGTYTYVCDKARYLLGNNEREANKVTLKVKIKKGSPTVTVKGSLSLNNEAGTNDSGFVDRSELTLITKNLPDGYSFDFAETQIKCKTKSGYEDNFEWELIDRQVGEDGKVTEGKLAASLKSYCEKGTYKFTILPAYSGGGETLKSQKAVNFSVKVYSGTISITLSSKGKVNLLDRFGQPTATNSIVYTPSIKNLKDKLIDVKVYDFPGGNYDGEESELFEAQLLSDGKIYVRPKEEASLKNNEIYKIRIWMELENYKFQEYVGGGGGMIYQKVLSIKTAQTLPKVTTDKSTVDLYLSNKDYVATFIVDKKDTKAIGNIESTAFGEKDTNAQESFVTTEDENGKETVIESEQLEDGSLQVKLKLRDTVLYSCNSTNKLTMYVRFEGQGTNTPGTAITMNVKINK